MAKSAELRVQHQQRWFHRSHATSLDYLETRELEQIKRSLVQSFFTYAILDGLGFGAMIPLLLINTCQRNVSMRTLDNSQILFGLVHLHRCRRERSR